MSVLIFDFDLSVTSGLISKDKSIHIEEKQGSVR